VSGPFADDQLAALVAQMPLAFAPGVAAIREGIAARAAVRSRGPEMHTVRNLLIGELAARLYRPVAEATPLVVYLHGGGWTVGSLESHDRACRRLAQ
jgi:acetyl esterase